MEIDSVTSPATSSSTCDSQPPTPSLFDEFGDLFDAPDHHVVSHTSLSPPLGIQTEMELENSVKESAPTLFASPVPELCSSTDKSLFEGWTEVNRKRRKTTPVVDHVSAQCFLKVPPVPVIFSVKDGFISHINPSLISETLQLRAGNIIEARLIAANELLVKVATANQADRLLSMKKVGSAELDVKLADSFAKPKGVIGGIDPYLTSDALLESLRGFGATEVVRKTFRGRGGRVINTSRVVVTFASQPLPSEVRIGFECHQVKPYVSPPNFCSNCCKWGHKREVCRSKTACGKCAGPHFTAKCPNPTKLRCSNCRQPHQASHHNCPARLCKLAQRRAVELDGLTWKKAESEVKMVRPKILAANVPKPGKGLSFSDVVAGKTTPSAHALTEKVVPSAALPTPTTRPQEIAANTNKRSSDQKHASGGSRNRVTKKKSKSCSSVRTTANQSAPSSTGQAKPSLRSEFLAGAPRRVKKPTLRSGILAGTPSGAMQATPTATSVAATFSPLARPVVSFSSAKTLPEASAAAAMDCAATNIPSENIDKFISKEIFDRRNEVIASTMSLFVRLINQLVVDPSNTTNADRLLALANSLNL